MAETFLSIQEASQVSGKSIQTIRRAIKTNRLAIKKKRTAQGFNYMVSRESLLGFYNIKDPSMDREHAGIQKTEQTSLFGEFATVDDLKKIQKRLEDMLEENKKEKENLVRFMKAFQDKFIVLENQMKLLDQPKNKKWFQFWKKSK